MLDIMADMDQKDSFYARFLVALRCRVVVKVSLCCACVSA